MLQDSDRLLETRIPLGIHVPDGNRGNIAIDDEFVALLANRTRHGGQAQALAGESNRPKTRCVFERRSKALAAFIGADFGTNLEECEFPAKE